MEDKKDNVLKYSVYTILYSNDIACNLLKDLSRFIPSEDKEAKKIHGALIKRIKQYLRMIEQIVGDNSIWFYADFNSFMDDKNNNNIEELTIELEKVFKDSKLEDYVFLSKLYVANTYYELALSTSELIIKKLKSLNMNHGFLGSYNLKNFQTIVNNLFTWCFRKIKEDINLNDNDKIVHIVQKITSDLLDYSTFEMSYNNAIIEANKRNGELRNESSR